ncbi:MAG: hypothetical protein AB8G05_22470 [Oligoflexales bacterium]
MKIFASFSFSLYFYCFFLCVNTAFSASHKFKYDDSLSSHHIEVILNLSDWMQLRRQRDSYELRHGIANYCQTRIVEQAYYPSICSQLGDLPNSKTRNLSNQKLKCAQAQHSHQRVGQKFDFDHWSSFLGSGDLEGKHKAYNYMRSLPPIRFEGSAAYQSYETWTYETCDKVLNGDECGHKSFCINKPVQQVINGKN